MKRIFLTALFATALIFTAEAQRTRTTYPFWTISKGVPQDQFRNAIYIPSVITVSKITTSSKGITAVQSSSDTRLSEYRKPKRIEMGGTPDWVISKGVARIKTGSRN